MQSMDITPRTITELKQISPDEISAISEQVMEADRFMNESTEELENLSQCLTSLSYSKTKYDEASSKVKKQMRNLIPKL